MAGLDRFDGLRIAHLPRNARWKGCACLPSTGWDNLDADMNNTGQEALKNHPARWSDGLAAMYGREPEDARPGGAGWIAKIC